MSTEQQCPYGCPPGKHADPAWLCYAERPDASTDSVVVAAIGARQERDRIEGRIQEAEERIARINELAGEMGSRLSHVATREGLAELSLQVGKLTGEIYAKVQALEVKVNTVSADLEHRIVVLESQMEQALGQIEGLTLARHGHLQLLDDPSREKLKALLRGKHQPASDRG